MSLAITVSTNDKIDHGSAAVLDNLSAFSFLMWFKPTSLTHAKMLFHKDLSENGFFVQYQTTPDELFRIMRRNTVGTDESGGYVTLSTTDWWCLAAVFELAGAANERWQIYLGDRDTPLAEVSYKYAYESSGALTDDSADSLIVGARGSNSALGVDAARLLFFTAIKSLAELERHRLRVIPGDSDLEIWGEYGLTGTGTQPDYSGNGNAGTGSGVDLAPHVPLPLGFGWDLSTPYVVAGGTIYYSTPAGSLSFAGVPTMQTQVGKAGVLTLAGVPIKQAQISPAGVLTLAGVPTKQTQTARTGTLTLAGIPIRQAQTSKAGVLTLAGDPTKQTQVTKAGTLTTSGTLDAIRTFLQSVAGTLSLAGSLVRQTGKQVAGTVTSAGAMMRQIGKALAGALSLAGSLAAALAGRVSPGPIVRAAIDGLRARAGLEEMPDVRAGTVFVPEIRGGEEL